MDVVLAVAVGADCDVGERPRLHEACDDRSLVLTVSALLDVREVEVPGGKRHGDLPCCVAAPVVHIEDAALVAHQVTLDHRAQLVQEDGAVAGRASSSS